MGNKYKQMIVCVWASTDGRWKNKKHTTYPITTAWKCKVKGQVASIWGNNKHGGARYSTVLISELLSGEKCSEEQANVGEVYHQDAL